MITVAAATLAAQAGLARAECVHPEPRLYPAGGSLPPRARLYHFGRADGLRVEVDGRPAPFAIRDVGVHDQYAIPVYEVTLEATAGQVMIDAPRGERHRYVIGAHAPSPAPVARSAKRVEDYWSCSYSDGIELVVRAPGVAAFRARWSDGVEAIVDPWSDSDGEPEAEPFLGHVSCVGHTIPPDRIGRLDLTLTALYPDGSEQAVALPARTLGDVTALLVSVEDRVRVLPEEDPAPRLIESAPWWSGWPRVAALGAVVSALAALTLRVRRRRVRARVP